MSSIFSGLSGDASAVDSVIDPKRLFRVLPKPSGTFKFPHDIQTEVWDQWFPARDKRDLILKMNTGSGKTVVGLVILKSSLNEGKGPAVYLVPNTQLQDQVLGTARELGIEVTDDARDGQFRRGRAVLVTTVHAMYNGRTKFGLEGSGATLEVGSIVIDDAHACIPIIEDQFSLSIPSGHQAYSALRALFNDALKAQSLSGWMGLTAGTGSHVVPVPYWEWQAKVESAMGLLAAASDVSGHDFDWPMVRDQLALCEAAFAPKAFEVRLPYPNTGIVPSFIGAARRVYMTATLADDSVLISKMGVDRDCVLNPITPGSASDLGDRIILTPSETSRSISYDDIKASAVRWAVTQNVVVIVPSQYKAAEWADHTREIHYKDSIRECIDRLRNDEHVGLVVFVNRYDGIDLPNDACRILILDGLPAALSLHEQVEATAIGNTRSMRARQVQRIEQGMGRGIRSTNDYCAVLLLDPRLAEYLYNPKDLENFSPATRAQFDLSTAFAAAGRGQTMEFFDEAIAAFLRRDAIWTEASKGALEDVAYERSTSVSEIVIAERLAFEHALAGRFRDAYLALQPAIDAELDHRALGWLKQRAATYLNFADRTQARELQRAARIDNAFILKVEGDTSREKLRAGSEQAQASADYVAQFDSGTALEVAVESLLRDLEPSPERNSHKRFEDAMQRLGLLLGFTSSRPDQEAGIGPDNFWCLGNQTYWVIECKSESTSSEIWRDDFEQLSHSVDWFDQEYADQTLTRVPVMIHNSRRPNWDAVPRQGARALPFDVLADFRAAIRDFATELAQSPSRRTASSIRESLLQFHLNAAALGQNWTKDFLPAATRPRG